MVSYFVKIGGVSDLIWINNITRQHTQPSSNTQTHTGVTI